MSRPLRILLADDHEMIRHGIRTLLAPRSEWTVCGEARTGTEAVALAETLRPDLLVLDLTMPELNGLEVARRVRRLLPACEILVLSMHCSESLTRELVAAGARGYVLKSEAGRLIVDAVEALSAGKPFFSSTAADALLAGPGAVPASDPLTSRERELLQRVAEGLSTKEAAQAMGISEKTAETHRANLMRKLDLHTVADIVRYAIRNHLVEP